MDTTRIMNEVDMLIAFGYEPHDVLKYAGYPLVAALSVRTQMWSNSNKFYKNLEDVAKQVMGYNGVDDDLIYYHSARDRDAYKNKDALFDMRRSWGNSTNFGLNFKSPYMKTGDKFICALFNSSGAARPNKWVVEVSYTNGSTAILHGGDNSRDFATGSLRKDVTFDYFDNGAADIPAPAGWRAPLYPKIDKGLFNNNASGRRI